jgi:hypothetical protein
VKPGVLLLSPDLSLRSALPSSDLCKDYIAKVAREQLTFPDSPEITSSRIMRA